MLPGPDYIYECNVCGQLLVRGSISSGNTLGQRTYSDGKTIAPMLINFPTFTKCSKCGSFLWIKELKLVKTDKNSSWFSPSNDIKEQTERIEFLNIDDCIEVLGSGAVRTNEEEFLIRRELWWLYNDRARRNEPIFNSYKDEKIYTENRKRLLNIIDLTKAKNIIMAAEINRNTGNFDKCRELLNSKELLLYTWAVDKILAECDKGNKHLVQLNEEPLRNKTYDDSNGSSGEKDSFLEYLFPDYRYRLKQMKLFRIIKNIIGVFQKTY